MPERINNCPEVNIPEAESVKPLKNEIKKNPVLRYNTDKGRANDRFIDEGDPRAVEELHNNWDGAGLG